MIINVSDNGKVLKDTPALNLPSLVILTGENGSGKTQLLHQILKFPDALSKFDVEPIEYSNIVLPEPTLLDDHGNAYKSINFIRLGFDFEDNIKLGTKQIILDKYQKLGKIAQFMPLNEGLKFDNLEAEAKNLEQKMVDLAMFTSPITNQHPLPRRHGQLINGTEVAQIKEISKYLDKDPRLLTQVDFLINLKTDFSAFKPELALLFHQYELQKKYYPELVKDIASPIDVLNQMMGDTEMPYQVSYEMGEDELVLSDISLSKIGDLGNKILVSDLSSGQQTIVSLIFALYGSRMTTSFPDVILFDEPDAHLHPSLTKKFLEVIEEIFVKEHNVKVILTTHSPSSVALAPSTSLYTIIDGVIQPISKTEAIKSLTNGLQLRVSPEHEVQVFVESDYDEYYYDAIYTILANELPKNKHLHFVSSGYSKIANDGTRIATCDQVVSITKKLRSYKNTNVWGIVDRDQKATSEPFVEVMGQGKRYAIENYLLDPILIGLILLDVDKINRQDIGLSNSFRYVESNKLSQNDCQKISDFIISKLFPNITEISSLELVECEYKNGFKLKIPKWFNDHHGHSLESIITNTFPELKAIRPKFGMRDLKTGMIEILKDFPNFISDDFSILFKSIINTY